MQMNGPGSTRKMVLAGAALAAVGAALLGYGSYRGLFVAPPEHYMGEVQRIMYVHVPTAWNALLTLTFAFGLAAASLFTRRAVVDALLEAAIEVGVLLAFLLCVQGSLWAKPTWGVWWDWDPRLTTVAVMLLAFVGVLGLRALVDDPARRATWSAVATIVAFADVPIVYFSVRWWNSLHQLQSTPKTVDPAMVLPLRVNAFGMLAVASSLILLRGALALRRQSRELALPPRPSMAPARPHPLGGEA